MGRKFTRFQVLWKFIILQDGAPKFTDEDWDYIYSEMKENFTDLEIVGWFYSCQGFSVNQAGQLLQMHKLNFEKRDKVLYLYDENRR